jgi:hypothetical protein
MDDEYFRLAIATRHDVGRTTAGTPAMEAALRSLQRPQQTGLFHSVVEQMWSSEVVGPFGRQSFFYPVWHVDLHRLNQVASRIARGLYFIETGMRVPSDFEAVAYQLDGFSTETLEELDKLRAVCDRARAAPPKEVGSGVFRYWFQRCFDLEGASLCFLELYTVVGFLCFIRPRSLS